MEHHCSKDSNIASKIFELGMKTYSNEPIFLHQYLKFLIDIKDDTNARALFERATNRMDPARARALYETFYEYESMYGDLSSATQLSARIDELFPDSNPLSLFGLRFSFFGCDPIAGRDLGLVKISLQPQTPQNGTYNHEEPELQTEGASMAYYESQSGGANIVAAHALPPPPPLHPSLMNFLKDLPPASFFGDTATFRIPEFLQLIREVDVVKAYSDGKGIPKRKIREEIPSDLIPLGRANDNRGLVKRRI